MNNQDMKVFRPSSEILAHNTIINFVGQIAVASSALILLPIVVRGLGSESYGVFALALVVFGSFAFLEFGLGRTTTKFVAEYLGKNDLYLLRMVFWTTVRIQLLLGLIFGVGIALAAPWLVHMIRGVSPEVAADARSTLFIIAAAAPVVMTMSSLRGTLEAAQRFDFVNYVKVILNISTYLIPAICVQFRIRVPIIVFFLLIVRLIAAFGYLLLCLYTIPTLNKYCKFIKDPTRLRALFSFSGWVALQNLTIPLLNQSAPYFITILVGVGAVTFYSVPSEILNGFWIIPSSIVGSLFPAFSRLKGSSGENLVDLYARSVKYNIAILGPSVFIMAMFSNDFLLWWQGPAFAERSTVILQILLFMVLINSTGWIPNNLLIALDHADIVAKISLAQVPLYFILSFLLIVKWGILGASIAILIRCIFETIVLFFATWFLIPATRRSVQAQHLLSGALFVLIIAGLLFGMHLLKMSLKFRIGMSFVFLTIYSIIIWKYVFDYVDKKLLYGIAFGLIRRNKRV